MSILATYEQYRITLPNGAVFLQGKTEPSEDFKKRVSAIVERDYCDELQLIDRMPAGKPKDMVGRMCSFVKRSTGELITGKIIWLYPDKRKRNMLYYRVKDSYGNLTITRTNNRTLKFF